MKERHVFVNHYETRRKHEVAPGSIIDRHEVKVTIEIGVEKSLPREVAIAITRAIRDSLLKSSLETPSSMFGNRPWFEAESLIEYE